MSESSVDLASAKDDGAAAGIIAPKRSRHEALSTLMVLGIICASSAVGGTPSRGEAEILKIEQDMAAAQTVDGVIATWDDAVTWYDTAPGEVDGVAAVRQDLSEQFTHVTNIRTKILRIKVVAGADVGFSFSTQHLIADGTNGAPGIDFVFRETDCFQRKAGKWLLIHQHISLPVDLRTGKAVLDSK
jgi:ketosteroid isomerase-like protein